MKLKDCTKEELLEILDRLIISARCRYLVDSLLDELETRRQDRDFDELLDTRKKIVDLLPKYWDNPRRYMKEMTALVAKKDRLSKRCEKRHKKIMQEHKQLSTESDGKGD